MKTHDEIRKHFEWERRRHLEHAVVDLKKAGHNVHEPGELPGFARIGAYTDAIESTAWWACMRRAEVKKIIDLGV